MIAIIDYNMGNVGSIRNMLAAAGAHAELVRDPLELMQATKIILPGVGAFDTGMRRLAETGLLPSLLEMVMTRRVPILGICLGMQMLCVRSDEGRLPGLGWIDAVAERFVPPEGSQLKVPHMGWAHVVIKKRNSLIDIEAASPRFYFVHSYYVRCRDSQDILATAKYGEEFVAAINRGNIFGVQFHPEKSHRFGLALMRNFVAL